MSALSPVAPGTPLRFAVDADSSVPLEFKFIRYRMSTGAWTVIQDYSFRPVWSWTPTLGDLDDYFLQIWVRARGSTNDYDSWQAFGPFTISQSPASLVALTSDAAPPIAPGTTITWTATARGGSLRLQYQFVSYSRARARWEIVRDWSPDPVWVQATTPLDEGENTVIVVVRSWGSDSSEGFQAAHTVIAAPQESYVLFTRPPAADLPGGRQIFFNDYTGGYLQASAGNGLSITATRTLPDSYVSAAMKSPDGAVPAAGVYENAERRYPDRIAGIPALEVNTTGDPCTSPLSGRFRILELEFDARRRRVARGGGHRRVLQRRRLRDLRRRTVQLDTAALQHVSSCVERTIHRRSGDLGHVDGRRLEWHGTGRISLFPLRRAGQRMDDGARLEYRPSIHLDAVHERLSVPSCFRSGPVPSAAAWPTTTGEVPIRSS